MIPSWGLAGGGGGRGGRRGRLVVKRVIDLVGGDVGDDATDDGGTKRDQDVVKADDRHGRGSAAGLGRGRRLRQEGRALAKRFEAIDRRRPSRVRLRRARGAAARSLVLKSWPMKGGDGAMELEIEFTVGSFVGVGRAGTLTVLPQPAFAGVVPAAVLQHGEIPAFLTPALTREGALTVGRLDRGRAGEFDSIELVPTRKRIQRDGMLCFHVTRCAAGRPPYQQVSPQQRRCLSS
jgi:hypothetical protein